MNFLEGETIRYFKFSTNKENVDLNQNTPLLENVEGNVLIKSENAFFQTFKLGEDLWRLFIVSGAFPHEKEVDVIGLVSYEKMVYFEGILESQSVNARKSFEMIHSFPFGEEFSPEYAFFSSGGDGGGESHENIRESTDYLGLDVKIGDLGLLILKKKKVTSFVVQVENQVQMIKRIKFELFDYESLNWERFSSARRNEKENVIPKNEPNKDKPTEPQLTNSSDIEKMFEETTKRTEGIVSQLREENEALKLEMKSSQKKNQDVMLGFFKRYEKRFQGLEAKMKKMMVLFKMKLAAKEGEIKKLKDEQKQKQTSNDGN